MLLRIEDLQTHFATPAGVVRAVDGVSLEIPAGRTLALVGESGCGKTLTALSVLRLVPPPGRIVAGGIWLDGDDLLTLPERQLRSFRGNRVAMIFQEPLTCLNPLLSVGAQIGEVLRLHRRLPARGARERTVELLRRVGIPAPEQRAQDYPHQMSGGMRQRVMIAMALACEPELLIADEPTTALDVTVQAQILALLRELQRQTGMALLFITHDLGVVAQIADTVCVMYAGRIVERAPAAEILGTPLHPYTQGLLRCTPRLTAGDAGAQSALLPRRPRGAGATGAGATEVYDGPGAARRLPVIPGDVPGAVERPSGCTFHPRCELGRDDPVCRRREPALRAISADHVCACWKAPGYAVKELAECMD